MQILYNNQIDQIIREVDNRYAMPEALNKFTEELMNIDTNLFSKNTSQVDLSKLTDNIFKINDFNLMRSILNNYWYF